MDSKLVLIHTVPPLIDVFNELGAELLPGVQLLHILDEPLLARVRQRGRLAPEDSERLGAHVATAAQIQANAVLVTCSTVSPCVDDVRSDTSIPVSKIDEAMVSTAITFGPRIGVVATAETTLEPTHQLLEAQAAIKGKEIQTEPILVENAFHALLNGDGAKHDHLVKNAILDLAPRVDVVILAQASMARVLSMNLEAAQDVPILSSPHLALQQLQRILNRS